MTIPASKIPASKKNTLQTLQNNATDLLVQCIYVVVHIFSQEKKYMYINSCNIYFCV